MAAHAALSRAAQRRMERLLRVATCLAESGYGAQVARLAACARALRADAQLWAAHARHRCPQGHTPLMQAARVGSVDRVLFLLECGANVEATGSADGETALMAACAKGRYEAVRALVERGGANVNAASSCRRGYTALMYTTFGDECEDAKYLRIARYLVERGAANVNASIASDFTGETALMMASCAGKLEMVRLLVQHGASVNAACVDSVMTAVMFASQEGYLEVVRFLIEHGAHVNVVETMNGGCTSLMWASERGYLEVVRCLLGGGATVNAAADSGCTALMSASKGGHLSTVRLLLEHGADRFAHSLTGWTAYDLAHSHPEVQAALA